jgi:hypothetical protein
MTPERFASLLRSDVTSALERFSLFVIDEAHLLAERDRGWCLEEALTLIHHLTKTTEHRLVLVSAAMGAGAHVVSWLTTDRPPLIKTDDWRGPRRLYALYTSDINFEAQTNTPALGTRLPRRQAPIEGWVHLRKGPGDVVHGRFEEPVGWFGQRQTRTGAWKRDANSSTSRLDQLVPLINHLVQDRSTPTLAIVATRHQARELAASVAAGLGPTDAMTGIVERVRAQVGELHGLPSLLERGVAYHHGALPSDVQAELEDAARAGLIRCLVATATLTEGVNLPFKAIVIGETGFGGGENRVELIDAPRLVNALGRAGRACKETEAWLFLARFDQYQEGMFNQLRQSGSDFPLTSSLLTEQALEDLSAFEEALVESRDAAVVDTGLATNEFCSFVWHLAEALNALGRAVDIDTILSVVRSSLIWQQADEELCARWEGVARNAKDCYDRTSSVARRRFARSGMPLSAAIVLDTIRGEVLPLALTLPPVGLHEWLDLLLGEGRLDHVLSAPGVRSARFRRYRTAPMSQLLDVDMLAMTHAWLGGAELEDLGDRFLAEIEDEDYRAEALSEFTSTIFEHHLPWALRALTNWLNEDLAELGLSEQVPAGLALHVHYGVPTAAAVELMQGGVRSRRLARVISSTSTLSDPTNVRQRLAEMDLRTWRREFGASPSELRDLLVFVRRAPALVCDVLDGQEVTVDIRPGPSMMSGPADLVEDMSEPPPRPLVIRVAGQLQGTVPSDSHDELRQLLDLGLPLRMSFDAGASALTITRVNISA